MAGLDPAIQSLANDHRCKQPWMAASEGGHDEIGNAALGLSADGDRRAA